MDHLSKVLFKYGFYTLYLIFLPKLVTWDSLSYAHPGAASTAVPLEVPSGFPNAPIKVKW
jgi:hypothetical protein